MFFLFDRQLIYCKKVSKPPYLARPVHGIVKGWGSYLEAKSPSDAALGHSVSPGVPVRPLGLALYGEPRDTRSNSLNSVLLRTPPSLTWSLPAPQVTSPSASLYFCLISLIPAASGLFTASFASFKPWHTGPMHEAFLVLSALSHTIWTPALVSEAFCPSDHVHFKRLDCPANQWLGGEVGMGPGHDQVVRQAAGQPGLRAASGRICSAGTCYTTRAGWTWMTWR